MTRSLQQEALLVLLRANGRVRRQFGDVFGCEGIGASQYNILRILRGAEEALPVMTIRERMLDPEPSITRLVDRLAERGLVHRERSKEDRRRVDVTITDEGLAVLARLDEPVDARDQELLARLTDRQLKSLIRLLSLVGEPE